MTHKREDYKISAVKYYLKNKDNFRKTRTHKYYFELIMDKPPL